MKQITIRHFGPIEEAEMNLDRLNLIIGLQGSGKSCAMIVACYCTWVEKRIVLRQSAKEFEQGTSFIDMLVSYYRAKGYLHADTYIGYSSQYMEFFYNHSERTFVQKWKGARWKYKRPKVSYIPAERNMISMVAHWDRFETSYDNILDFKQDWDTARRFVKNESDILGTGISYKYDDFTDSDTIITATGKPIELTNSSSGMQSLVPLFVLMDYLTEGIYKAEKDSKDKSLSEKLLVYNLLDTLYKRHYEKVGQSDLVPMEDEKEIVHIEGRDYVFEQKAMSDIFTREADDLLRTNHAEVFLEEPESNLFPPTQFQLMDWIVEKVTCRSRRNFFFITTHSPYVLSHLIEENIKDFALFLTYPSGNGLYKVKKANAEELQEIYDNGADAFFNFDAFVDKDETI